MQIREIIRILEADVLCGEDLSREVLTACGSDMMSDVLAYVKDQGMLLTGLVNPQAVRTAEMLDMGCITFVRGKTPGPDILELAMERGIVILRTRLHLFTACGRLYSAGLRGGTAEE